MRRLRLVLQYDGTAFSGFQRQPGCRTVQEVLEEHLTRVCGHPVEVIGAGRTDAGVHALGQVVHLDTTGRIPPERLSQAVNRLSGGEMVVRQVEETSERFHARFSAVRRTYRYNISRAQPSPVLARYSVYEPWLAGDAGVRMREATAALVGRHDFRAFCVGAAEERSCVRTMLKTALEERGALLCVELTADAFLRSMVRMIAGMLLKIGRGQYEPRVVVEALRSGRHLVPPLCAPPHGLFLMRVEYPDGYPPLLEEAGVADDLTTLVRELES